MQAPNGQEHLVILTPGFPADTQDDTCIPPLQAYILELKSRKNSPLVTVISFQYPFSEGVYTWNGVEVFALAGQNRGYFYKFITWYKAFKALSNIHNRLVITRMHSFWLGECSLIGRLFSLVKNIPMIATLQGQDAYRTNWYLYLIRWLNLKVTSGSDFSAKKLRKAIGLKAQVVPFGLSKDSVVLPTQEHFKVDILGIGNLSAVKNYPLFIDIVAEVAKVHPQIQVAIIGGWGNKEALEARAKRMGVSEQISFMGHLSRHETMQVLAFSRMVLHTATFEGQCYVFLEALANGIDVVHFPVGFMPPSPLSHPCKTKQDMVAQILAVLQTQKVNRGGEHAFFYPIQKTVDEFERIFDS